MLQLTPEQQAIVAHNKGPALVFAVAGAGKTTAMVHRIERLVRERIFRPERILATSFSRATVDDISKALKVWSYCSRVQAITLHSLGWRILNRAHSLRLVDLQLSKENDPERLADSMLNQALGIARDRGIVDKSEGRNIDREDFQTFVSSCMGNLQYPDLAGANLPTDALTWATQAVPPSNLPWYLDLYRIYEQVRSERRAVTFDYMLFGAWEMLMRHEALRNEWQAAFDCLIVDEFQDVNLVQSELLDLLSSHHRNYMVIGDDDQTIYEWRGARPHFILRFAQRYGAKSFFVSDNFRCKASQVVLANQIISHNVNRQQKSLHLTRGFDGRTFAHEAESIPAMGRQIVAEIKAAREKGVPLRDIAILVRLYAQTPHIEHPLIEEQIPYKIIGSTPFYDRPEVRVLLCYLRVARLNRLLLAGIPLSSEECRDLGQMWRSIFNRPLRYISSELGEQIFQDVCYYQISLNQAIQKHAGSLPSWQRKHLDELADNLLWLTTRLGPETDPQRQQQISLAPQPPISSLHPPLEEEILASSVLHELELRLDYKRFLLRNSGFPENGEGRARNVEGLLEYADGKGTPIELLDHIARISFEKQRTHASSDNDFVSLLTIFRAKGLEWPVVFIPDCNDGTIPFRGNQGNLEEERRLLYVAVTRTKRELHLYILRKNRTSPFLLEANYITTLQNIEHIRHVLESPPQTWRVENLLIVARHTQKLQLERYFSFWWEGHQEQKTALAREIQKIFRLAIQKKWLEQLELDEKNLAYWEEFGVFDQLPDATFTDELQRIVGLPLDAPSRRNVSDVSQSPFVLGKTPVREEYVVGARVRHPSYGVGTILEAFEVNSNLRLVIDFGAFGTRRIAPGFVKMEILSTNAQSMG